MNTAHPRVRRAGVTHKDPSSVLRMRIKEPCRAASASFALTQDPPGELCKHSLQARVGTRFAKKFCDLLIATGYQG